MLTIKQTESSNLEAKLNLGYIWLISAVAAMGGLLFGWDWVVIGGAKPFFQRYFQLTSEAQIGWANSCALVGCLVGALVAGALSDKIRAQTTADLVGVPVRRHFAWQRVWRTVSPCSLPGGCLAAWPLGLASNLSPMYIAEVAPAQMRGKLVSVNQLTIVIGILLAQVINWCLVRNLPQGATDEFIRNSWFGQSGWRWMFGLTAVPSLLFFLGMFIVPGKPAVARKKRAAGAGTEASWRKSAARLMAQRPLREIESTLASEKSQHVRFAELLDPKMAKVLVLGVTLAVFQQWCGINVIFNYAEEIFKAAGYDISSVLSNIAWTGSVNLVFTFVALGAVDRAGRRPLMLVGSAGLAVIYTAMGLCYANGVKGLAVLLLVLAAIGCYAMSLAPVTWVVISEIFPNRIRGAAMSVAVCGTVDRVLPPDLHVSAAERQTRPGGHVLAICGNLRARLCLHQTQTAGNQK